MGQTPTYHPLIPRVAPASLLSVVVPVYSEQTVVPILREAVDHVGRRAAARGQIGLVNDGSTDRTIDAWRLLAWANEGGRVVVIGTGEKLRASGRHYRHSAQTRRRVTR